MSEEEIKKQYANGIVNADEVIKSLIDKFKIDKASVDIQQLQLIAEYLIYKADKLQKDNYKLDRENQHYFDRIQDLQKENEELKEEIKKQYKQYIKDHTEVIEDLKKDSISKDKIKEFKNLLLKELDRDFVTEEYRQAISCYFEDLLKENNNE